MDQVLLVYIFEILDQMDSVVILGTALSFHISDRMVTELVSKSITQNTLFHWSNRSTSWSHSEMILSISIQIVVFMVSESSAEIHK